MKGVIFSEFLDVTEERFGLEVVDRIIENSDLPSGGVYTRVGTYDHNELLKLITNLSAVIGTPVPELVLYFGEVLFGNLISTYPTVLEGVDSTFGLLEILEDHIHYVEVAKLYPDAEFPRFKSTILSPDRLELTYQSMRPLAVFAEGMIRGCIKHFGESIDIVREDPPEADGTAARFVLTKS